MCLGETILVSCKVREILVSKLSEEGPVTERVGGTVSSFWSPFRAGTLHAQPPGAAIFASNCATCHGADGRGGEHAPNIATAPEVQTSDGS